jgi:tetratricopeptide (TPR) repeat protein
VTPPDLALLDDPMTITGSPVESDDAWLSRRYYGGDLPAEAERELHLAGQHYCDSDLAELHLARAAAAAPGHRAVDLGHYKYFLYKARLKEALAYAHRMLDHASAGIGLNHSDWRQVTRRHADFDAIELAPRFYLFTIKALGYLHIRLGRSAEGRELLDKMIELDPADRIGARPLLAVLDRRESAGEDDEA